MNIIMSINNEQTEILSIIQIEEKNQVVINGKKVPFGYQTEKWEELKKQYQSGDIFEWFSSSQNAWMHLAGREGYRLKRNGQIIGEIITFRT